MGNIHLFLTRLCISSGINSTTIVTFCSLPIRCRNHGSGPREMLGIEDAYCRLTPYDISGHQHEGLVPTAPCPAAGDLHPAPPPRRKPCPFALPNPGLISTQNKPLPSPPSKAINEATRLGVEIVQEDHRAVLDTYCGEVRASSTCRPHNRKNCCPFPSLSLL